MKSSIPLKHRGPSRSADIRGRCREISSHWSPVERGRRLLLAAARQAELCAAIGLNETSARLPYAHSDYAAPRFSPTKDCSR